jgi:exodeoxyribonuclease VII large subunit
VSGRRRGASSPDLLELFSGDEVAAFAPAPTLVPVEEPAPPAAKARRGRAKPAAAAAYDVPNEYAVVSQAPGEYASEAATIPGASPASAVAVSTLTQTARDVLEGAFVPLWVRGEVSDFKAHRNGHWYFSLRDRTAQVRCVVWARDQRHMLAAPDDGMQVCALGQVTVYPSRGELQFSVKALDAQGDGLWRKALEATRAALDADGLLSAERKRALPRFPRVVAVVTSPDGAALHDIISVIRRRYLSVEIVVVPTKVQGDGAPEEICAALARVERWGGADVLIVGRGGGAREDLWAFNDERVARAVAASSIPTISAVGHEVDVTICDLVADHRAATPSAAAEAAVPVLDDLIAGVHALGYALAGAATRQVARARTSLERTARSVRVAASTGVERRRARMEQSAGQLHALSPLATLARGYAAARGDDGEALPSVRGFTRGMPFQLLLRDGVVQATVDSLQRGAPRLDRPLPTRRAQEDE